MLPHILGDIGGGHNLRFTVFIECPISRYGAPGISRNTRWRGTEKIALFGTPVATAPTRMAQPLP